MEFYRLDGFVYKTSMVFHFASPLRRGSVPRFVSENEVPGFVGHVFFATLNVFDQYLFLIVAEFPIIVPGCPLMSANFPLLSLNVR
jgi:hypothetical protein